MLTLLYFLQVLKILSRKADNRRHVNDSVIIAVVSSLQTPATLQIAAEAANVLLNICYEQTNVDSVLRNQGIQPLVQLLGDSDLDAQANAAGAIQSICFQQRGRKGARDAGAIPKIISLLGSNNIKVCARSVGALHNISSDPDAIGIIRRCVHF